MMFPVDRIRNYTLRWRKLSAGQKEELRLNGLVVLAMSALIGLISEMPTFVPDTIISDVSAVFMGLTITVLGLSTQIKRGNPVKRLTLMVGFVGLIITAYVFLLSKIQAGLKILSTDVATLDFKLAGMTFALLVALTAIGLIHDMRMNEDPPTDPRRYA